MGNSNVLLVGFEGALAQAICDRFRFKALNLRDIPLQLGRHLHVQDLPSPKEIADTIAPGSLFPYDPTIEPAIVIYTGSGPKAPTSGGRHEFPIEIVMRLPQVNEATKALLEELVTFIEAEFGGVIAGGFQIKRAKIETAPAPIGRQENDQVLVSAAMRFFAVPMPR